MDLPSTDNVKATVAAGWQDAQGKLGALSENITAPLFMSSYVPADALSEDESRAIASLKKDGNRFDVFETLRNEIVRSARHDPEFSNVLGDDKKLNATRLALYAEHNLAATESPVRRLGSFLSAMIETVVSFAKGEVAEDNFMSRVKTRAVEKNAENAVEGLIADLPYEGNAHSLAQKLYKRELAEHGLSPRKDDVFWQSLNATNPLEVVSGENPALVTDKVAESRENVSNAELQRLVKVLRKAGGDSLPQEHPYIQAFSEANSQRVSRGRGGMRLTSTAVVAGAMLVNPTFNLNRDTFNGLVDELIANDVRDADEISDPTTRFYTKGELRADALNKGVITRFIADERFDGNLDAAQASILKPKRGGRSGVNHNRIGLDRASDVPLLSDEQIKYYTAIIEGRNSPETVVTEEQPMVEEQAPLLTAQNNTMPDPLAMFNSGVGQMNTFDVKPPLLADASLASSQTPSDAANPDVVKSAGISRDS